MALFKVTTKEVVESHYIVVADSPEHAGRVYDMGDGPSTETVLDAEVVSITPLRTSRESANCFANSDDESNLQKVQNA